MSAPPKARAPGAPIAVYAALLVAIALIASFIVIIATLVMLPPRPPEVVRGDKVIDTFAASYARALKGQKPATVAGAQWRIAPSAPRQRRGPPHTRILTRELAARLGVAPEKVVVSFAPPPRDVLVFRLRREEFRALHIEHDRHRHDADGGEHKVRREIKVEMGVPLPPAAGEPPEPPEPPELPRFAPPPSGVVLIARFQVAAELPDGRWLAMRQRSTTETYTWYARAALAIGGTLGIVFLLVLVFARRLAAPIERFAESARRVGVDQADAAVREEGPRELRTAARAVNAMQARLRALVADRTEMLATVAHDLRTPLMRLRLAAEKAEPAVRDKLVKEAAEIDALVSSFIAFARDDPSREERKRLDLSALVQSVADDRAETGAEVSCDSPERMVMTGQAVALRRLFGNLIDNAVKYGAVARVSMRREGARAVIDIVDDGPGIAPEERERVFRPFLRGADTGEVPGAGLGLTTAREIARAHGGEVEILDGAIVRVTLPM